MKINQITNGQISLIQNGNERLFEELIKDNQGFFNGIVQRFGRQIKLNVEYVEDLRQEAYLSFWKSLKKFDPEKASLSTFAFRVIYNDVLQSIKKNNKIMKNENFLTDISPSSSTIEDESGGMSAMDYFYAKQMEKNGSSDSQFDSILQNISLDTEANKLDEIFKTIFEGKREGLNRKQIAKKLNLNIHTYKYIYYNSFLPKMKLKFGENFEKVFNGEIKKCKKTKR